MRALVTGADGFIGRNALALMVQAGFEVHALYWRESPEPMDGILWHRIDLLKVDEMDAFMEEIRPTHLLHLAWYTEHGKYWRADENLGWVASSLALLLSFVKYGGQRVTIAGTCAEYDWMQQGCCSETNTPCRPATLYGVSKHALHQVAEAFCYQHDVGFAWGRVFFLYGPGEMPARFIPAVLNGLLSGEKVVCSDGSQVRDFMHVNDAASAFVSLLDSDVQGAVNIASGQAHAMREIGERLMQLVGGSGMIDFGALPNRPDDPAVLTANVSRLQEELNWYPRYTLDEGLADTVAWWRRKRGLMHVD